MLLIGAFPHLNGDVVLSINLLELAQRPLFPINNEFGIAGLLVSTYSEAFRFLNPIPIRSEERWSLFKAERWACTRSSFSSCARAMAGFEGGGLSLH